MGNIERLPVRQSSQSVAVLLNANAKSVSDGLRRELGNFVPAKDLFFSRSFEDARHIARTVLERGYRTVLTGGGDGTFVGYVNCLFDQATMSAQQPMGRGAFKLAPVPAYALQLPRIGALKLGTGNAVADFGGASSRRLGVVEDILRARSGEVSTSRPLHLLTHEGKRAPFAGLGIDAALLNDYCRLKDKVKGTSLQFLGTGGMGYFCSIVGRTIPTYAFGGSVPNVEVVNLGGPAQQLGPDGKPVGREIQRGEILYRGPCKIAAAGTVPNYGFGFQIFPHALSAPGKFQLRLAAISVPKILTNLRTLWSGGTAPSGIFDFHCDRVLVKFDREMPLQVGGDAEGYRREVVLEMAERPLELLDFRARPLQA
ncbi:MAG TPA: diacylglycerol kinase family protein [Myxococcales bacterium]|jgi:diacylglycerol kinase family enzyme|nr:diacylglycerol kinase family protein [Myxococcales bacterium]